VINNFLVGLTAGFMSEADEILMISSLRSSSHTIPEDTWLEMRCSIWCAHSISDGHSASPVGFDVQTSCWKVSYVVGWKRKYDTYCFELFLSSFRRAHGAVVFFSPL